jgi:hypothetical protein
LTVRELGVKFNWFVEEGPNCTIWANIHFGKDDVVFAEAHLLIGRKSVKMNPKPLESDAIHQYVEEDASKPRKVMSSS